MWNRMIYVEYQKEFKLKSQTPGSNPNFACDRSLHLSQSQFSPLRNYGNKSISCDSGKVLYTHTHICKLISVVLLLYIISFCSFTMLKN